MSELRKYGIDLQGVDLLEHITDLIEDMIRQKGQEGYLDSLWLFHDSFSGFSPYEVSAALGLGEQEGRFSTGDYDAEGFIIQLNDI